ncbi:MAG TPA: hypothetical protein VGI10_02400 [Polyangiaceae bacterium]|jgi:hypothetical protein
MKTVSFLSGNKLDPSNEYQIEVDRKAAPAGAKVGLWLDDDGKLFPQVARSAPPAANDVAAFGAEFVLLDRARIRTSLGPMSGVLTLEPGTQFDLELFGARRVLNVKGGSLAVKGGRRFVAVESAVAQVHMNRVPNVVNVLTLEWEPPPGANKGDRFPIHVTQKSAQGVVMGGITFEFVVD